MNKAFLVGRVGTDPVLRCAKTGNSVCSFSLATDSISSGHKKTEWHSVICFEKLAENCAKYLKKGHRCAVDGKVTYYQYEKNGEKRTLTRISASDVQFLESKKDTEQNITPSFDANQDQSDGFEEAIPF